MSDQALDPGTLRVIDYDDQKWVNVGDLKDLANASQERFDVEGCREQALTMAQFCESIRALVG